jgi:hypothetical protein
LVVCLVSFLVQAVVNSFGGEPPVQQTDADDQLLAWKAS